MSVVVLRGDARQLPLADESVHCAVTSPPYLGLRRYLPDGHSDSHREIGSEATVQEYVATIVDVFREVRRVLRRDGTLWLNIGDSYAGSGKGPSGHNGIGDQEERQGFTGGRGITTSLRWGADARYANAQRRAGRGIRSGTGDELQDRGAVPGLKPKDLMLVPERLAVALQDDGWWVRARIAWCKTSAMPESVQDRPTSAWEHIWLLSRSRTYFYDAEAVRQPNEPGTLRRYGSDPAIPGSHRNDRLDGTKGNEWAAEAMLNGANLRNYWVLGPSPFSEAHFATFPPEIPRRAILAGTSAKGVCPECGAPWRRVVDRVPNPSKWANVGEDLSGGAAITANPQTSVGLHRNNGNAQGPQPITLGWQPPCRCDAGEPVPATVLDPFAGAGTTLLVADRLGRNGIGVELNFEYIEMARRRLANDAPMFFGDGLAYAPAATAELDKQGRLEKRTYAGFNARWDAAEATAQGASESDQDTPLLAAIDAAEPSGTTERAQVGS